MKILTVFYAAFIWFLNGLKLTSLPKLYYRLSSKRGIPVKHLRELEKNAIKYARRQLDVHYLEYCYDLGICPETFKFKVPDIAAYRSTKEFYDVALKKQRGLWKYNRVIDNQSCLLHMLLTIQRCLKKTKNKQK